jgi:hypothetical protein
VWLCFENKRLENRYFLACFARLFSKHGSCQPAFLVWTGH